MQLSIIIPIYNASLYLDECIKSVVTQSFKDFELILIDDGSTDNSLSICEKYAESDDRVVVLTGPNSGVSSARNKGLEVARGEWIAFADSDDYYLPDALSHLMNSVDSRTDLVLASCNVVLRNGKVTKMIAVQSGEGVFSPSSIKHYALWGYLFKSAIIKKEKLRFIEGLPYSEDRLFLFRATLYYHTIKYVDEIVYVYRRNESSACASSNVAKKAKGQFDVAMEMGKLLPLVEEKSSIEREIKSIKRMGVGACTLPGCSLADFKMVRDSFQEHFGKSISEMFFFYKAYLGCLFTNYRRLLYKGEVVRVWIRDFRLRLCGGAKGV